eukprot:5220285-Pleurochrysis_carterae.AAC.1
MPIPRTIVSMPFRSISIPPHSPPTYIQMPMQVAQEIATDMQAFGASTAQPSRTADNRIRKYVFHATPSRLFDTLGSLGPNLRSWEMAIAQSIASLDYNNLIKRRSPLDRFGLKSSHTTLARIALKWHQWQASSSRAHNT